MPRPKKFLIYSFLFVVFAFVSLRFNIFHKIQNLFLSIVHKPVAALSLVSSKIHTKFKGNAKREIDILEAKVRHLEDQLMRLEELRIENERLQELMKLARGFRGQKVFADVLAGATGNLERTVLISKGQNQGIEKNMAVLAQGGLIGRVIEVYGNMSKVMLITDLDSKIGALIQRTRDVGVVVGLSDRTLKIVYLPIEASLKEGDAVISSGMGGVFPKGMFIGRIREVGHDAIGMYTYALIDSSADLAHVEEVVCIK